ncbi:hypothetical protein QTH97_28025 [Variovorax sp. J22R24]|uniref:ATP-dependent DNA ligase n=1 Tax=Variovorax gracilis TaxID=3053502 RepID=UPI002577D745|nr:hypothetical protein [Variovorax sp. J22R24]MDM0108820.1 hypothetical protein [Variovorax sp. J22R24]
MLDDLAPMLLDERPFTFGEPGWIYEIKLDGYRLLAEFGNGECILKTRNGANATEWFPEIARSLSRFKGGPYVVDGEVCVFDDRGRSDFDRLQDRARRRRWHEGAAPVVYAVFDLLVYHGVDITASPLSARKEALSMMLEAPLPSVLLVAYFGQDGDLLFSKAVHELGLEGIVAKHVNSRYLPGSRTADWVKVKREVPAPAARFKRS